VSERHRRGNPASLVRAINFLPATGGEKSTYTRAEEAECWRKYGLSPVAGADDGIVGTVIIDGGPSSEASTRPDSTAIWVRLDCLVAHGIGRRFALMFEPRSVPAGAVLNVLFVHSTEHRYPGPRAARD
jgi:hypothetical protein